MRQWSEHSVRMRETPIEPAADAVQVAETMRASIEGAGMEKDGATTLGATMSSQGNDGRIDYIELTTHDVERSKTFFADAFGWKFTDYGPDYTSFEDGRLAGGLRRGEAAGTDGAPLIVIYAADLEGTQASVEEAGGSVTVPIFSFPGGRRFHFREPSGNELAVWSE